MSWISTLFLVLSSIGGANMLHSSNQDAQPLIDTKPTVSQTLDTAELQVLIRNVTLKRIRDPGILTSDQGLEYFYQTGEYRRRGDRAGRTGSFSITEGRVCIFLSGMDAPDCFRLQRDSDGSYWKIDGAGTRTHVEIFTLE